MDFLQLFTDAGLLTAVSTAIGSVITYFVTKNNNNKDLAINDRTQLSKDQYQLIAELRTMMQEQKEEIEELREEIKQLQAVNINLTIENKELQEKITKLNNRLDKKF
ncbi:TPA: hypothetical protein ACGW8Q_005812 [Bacillus cereus]